MPTLLIRDASEQNLKFYQRYDPFFIASKVKVLMLVSETWEDFLAFAAERDTEFGSDPKKAQQGLRAHVRFAEFQQFEACFALMLAPFQALPHWSYLTTYKTAELLKSAESFVSGDAKAMSDSRVATIEEFVDSAIYAGMRSKDAVAMDGWTQNIENMCWMFRIAAERYVKAAAFGGEYNCYKHGLRVLTGRSQIGISTQPDLSDVSTLALSDDSVTFLELEREGDGQRRVVEVVRHFNPIESYHFIDFMSILAQNMKRSRLARLTGSTEVQLHHFTDLDKQAVRNLSTFFEYRLG